MTRLLMLMSICGQEMSSSVSREIGGRSDVQFRYRYNQPVKDASFPQLEDKVKLAAFSSGRALVPIPKQNHQGGRSLQRIKLQVEVIPIAPWVPVRFVPLAPGCINRYGGESRGCRTSVNRSDKVSRKLH
jgi:hypothetical protein